MSGIECACVETSGRLQRSFRALRSSSPAYV
jgi:hypothetical protein